MKESDIKAELRRSRSASELLYEAHWSADRWSSLDWHF